jgi:HEPN domain-containing protein
MNANRQEAQRWLSQAQHDLRAAATIHREGFPETACFLAQQAAEKALKAYLYAQGERAVLGHATHLLVRQCARYDPASESLLDACRTLDQYYISTRYPNGLPDGIPHEVYTGAQAEGAVGLARQVLEWVGTAIKGTA